MPSWGEILVELQATQPPDLDGVRRKYLAQLHALTGRSTVLYATDFLGSGGPQTSIGLGDMSGLMEVFRDLPGPNLDLILHSPGGQAEATERVVRYMRSKFDHVRVFVPLAAMSAATMWSMAADEIVLGKHSQVGPIDPQIVLPSGMQMPAGALIDQFKSACDELEANEKRLTGWLPTLQQYPPGLLSFCDQASALSKTLVAEWLAEYMLKGNPDGGTIAQEAADWLGDDKTHLSHSRPITRDQLRAKGLTGIVDLEDSQALQDAVLSVHHAAMHTLGGSAVKIIENHLGRAFIQHGGQQIVLQMPPGMPQPGPLPPGP